MNKPLKQTKVLIVDDEGPIRKSLNEILEDEGFDAYEAGDGKEALRLMAEVQPDAVLLDIWMPGIDGLEVLSEAKKRHPGMQFVIMSGHGNIETAVKATKLGAFDFIEKPISLEKLMIVLKNAIDFNRLKEENAQLISKLRKDINIVGDSQAMKALRAMIARVAPTHSWVLITGENGTGKELVAQNIHYQSVRAARAFVEVNCAAIPEDLIESELFGHEKGAFTGAVAQRKGKFDQAHGGTLFLDEIADMSLKTQAKILRILQEQRFERVGGHETIFADVRVVAATNKDLEAEIKSGRFREDLYYRLNVIPFRVPALRERIEDIPILAKTFADGFARESGVPAKGFTQEALELLQEHAWPGNVRELRNLIERVFILCPGLLIDAADLKAMGFTPSHKSIDEWPIGISSSLGSTLREARAEFEKSFILRKLEEFDGNVSRTAEMIGVERSHLHRKIKSYGIEV
ncbi:MAG: sigma-54-dependent Fis family transcriptional regulator [Oligoflexia bacterium]|nr:sigma-54-dependent Fis family transcriptional regulator [Oligoflexia bacterium]